VKICNFPRVLPSVPLSAGCPLAHGCMHGQSWRVWARASTRILVFLKAVVIIYMKQNNIVLAYFLKLSIVKERYYVIVYVFCFFLYLTAPLLLFYFIPYKYEFIKDYDLIIKTNIRRWSLVGSGAIYCLDYVTPYWYTALYHYIAAWYVHEITWVILVEKGAELWIQQKIGPQFSVSLHKL